MSEPTTAKLGDHRYVVVPQRQARILRQLPAVIGSLGTAADQEAKNVLSLLGEKAYDALKVLIPDLMPRWEWEGYASEQAALADDYDEARDLSPTVPEVQAAFAVAFTVNGIDKFKLLGNVISPELIRALISAQAATILSTLSQRSPSRNGAPDSTTSTTTAPTPETPASVAGPFPD